MLTREDIKSLAALTSAEWPIISFYLRMNRRQSGAENFASTIRNLLREAEEKLPDFNEAQSQAIHTDLQRIERTATDERVAGSHSLAIIASSALGIWQMFHLPELTESVLKIGKTVYLKPLAEVLDKHEKYCVVLINKEKARLFIVYLGEITDYSEIFDEVPGKHDQGGWSQMRLQRHHDDHVLHHIKRTADLAFDFFQREGFDSLIIGGTEEVVSQFPEYLHSYLKDRLIATISLDVDSTTNDILEQSLQVERNREQETERKLVGLLKGQFLAHGQAVAGLETSLEAIHQGQAMTVLIDESFRASGVRCAACDALAMETATDCTYCEGENEPVDDLVNAIVRQTLRRDGEVEFITAEDLREEMKTLGGIGVLLRYRPS